jgi:LmbE family N-acetylglucosaminyl deacetylase
MAQTLNVVMVGAHPDDCEYAAGAVTVCYRQLGHKVIYLSMTNGDAGHHSLSRDDLKRTRYEETRKVAEYLDVEYEVMDIHDGGLEPTLENRYKLIRILRKYQPDIIITHPLNDYHPDHRYTAQLVSDTAYMLKVPLCVPDAPAMRKETVYCHFSYEPQDNSKATVIVPIDKYIDKKVEAFHQNTSQVYEWIPWIENISDPIPSDEKSRLAFLKKWWSPEWSKAAENYRQKLALHLGSKAAGRIKYVEAFAASPYGYPLTVDNAAQYFPFPDAVVF